MKAIERERAAQTLEEAEARFRQLTENIDEVFWIVDPVNEKVLYVSPAYEEIWGRTCQSLYADLHSYLEAIHPDYLDQVRPSLATHAAGENTDQEYQIIRPDGVVRWVRTRGFPIRDESGQVYRVVGVSEDITQQKRIEAELRERNETLETINRIGQVLSAELDLQKLVQSLTDAATEITGAQFGAFFYNVLDERGEAYTLYTLSGVPREAFANFPMPRATAMFGPTFRGEGTILIEDVRKDPRYGKNDPYYGMPKGHLPVVSYLAVPVVSRSGEVLGGLFFGHPESGIFKERHVRLVEGLAAQTAIAMDNARLYESLKRERGQLAESERRYKLLADSVPQLVWATDENGQHYYYNRRWYEYTGLSEEESLGFGFANALHPDDKDRTLARWQRAWHNGEGYEIEYRFYSRPQGVYRWFLGRAEPVRGAEGQIVSWFGTCTDIDDQKRLQERLRLIAEASAMLANSLDYEATLASVANLVVPHLADWCAIDIVEEDRSVNRIAVAHSDPNKMQLVHELQQRYPPDPKQREPLHEVLETGKSQFASDIPDSMLIAGARDSEHLKIIRDLGLKSYIIAALRARGKTLGAITLVSAESGRRYTRADLELIEDLAGRAALAVDNARLYREAQVANRAKDEFLATVSHELRTPLNAILGWTQILRSRRLDDAGALNALETVERNARLQAQIINDILDVSRIITGKLRLEMSPVEPSAVIHAAVQTVKPAADSKDIRLQVLLDSDAGPIYGDADRLQQVVWNLLSNAIKFTPKGGRVQIRLQRVDSHIEVTVSDTGQGISPEFLPHVFERFRQAESTSTRTYGGLGLGLAIVRHLVELHGGTVQAESLGEGHGATFTLTLPLMIGRVKPRELVDSDLLDESGFPAGCAPALDGVKVLIVDDEPDARDLLKSLLAPCGAEVRVAASAAEAFEEVRREKPDILVSDIGMPDQDGYSLIRRVRALPREAGGDIPAIALTAYARTEDRIRTLAAGFQLHIPKPVELTELTLAIASLTGRTGRG